MPGIWRARVVARMRLHVVTIVSALSIAGSVPAVGQSLAGVARAEEDRRKTAPRAEKVYTNEDLKPEPTTPSRQPAGDTPPPSSATIPLPPDPSSAGGKEAPESLEDPAGATPVPGEKEWRARITAAREQVERTQLFAESLQSRINALTTDFINRDDPAQRSLIDQDRSRSLAELERVKTEIEEATKAVAAIEEEARKAGVPPAWLRPPD